MNSATTLHPQGKQRVLVLGIKPGATRWNRPPSVTEPPAPAATVCRFPLKQSNLQQFEITSHRFLDFVVTDPQMACVFV